MSRQVKVQTPSTKTTNLPPHNDDPPQPSSASAHSLQPYEYVDEPERESAPHGLPAYRDDPSTESGQDGNDAVTAAAARLSSYQIPGGRSWSTRTIKSIITLDSALSQDPNALHALVLTQSHLPPKPIIRLTGNHSEAATDRNGKKTQNTVVDFDFRVDTGETLLPSSGVVSRAVRVSLSSPSPSPYHGGEVEDRLRPFRKLRVVEDGETAYRGGRMKARAPGWKSKVAASDVEAGTGEREPSNSTAPHLGEWCRRFCEDPAGTKMFTFSRYITEWDVEMVKSAFQAYIRAVNYRGNIFFTQTTAEAGFTVYSPSFWNRMRTNTFVWWTCVILQLWIFTWPLLWLVTRRYEVVSCEWPFSVPPSPSSAETGARSDRIYLTGRSEIEWAAQWRPAVQKAALGRRMKGEWVTQRDMELAFQAEDTETRRRERQREAEPREQGTSGFFASAIRDIARGVGSVNEEYQRRNGWGGDRN